MAHDTANDRSFVGATPSFAVRGVAPAFGRRQNGMLEEGALGMTQQSESRAWCPSIPRLGLLEGGKRHGGN